MTSDRKTPEQVLAEMKVRRTRQLAVSLSLGAVMFYVVFGLQQLVGVVIAIPILVFALFNWRCPACSAYLGKPTFPSFCHSCGVRLKP